MMTQSVEELAKLLYPEDVYNEAAALTLGELKVLQHLRMELEERVRPILIKCYEKAQLPRQEILTAFRNARIMNHPSLFEGRDEKWRVREIYNAFLYLEMARFDPSVAG